MFFYFWHRRRQKGRRKKTEKKTTQENDRKQENKKVREHERARWKRRQEGRWSKSKKGETKRDHDETGGWHVIQPGRFQAPTDLCAAQPTEPSPWPSLPHSDLPVGAALYPAIESMANSIRASTSFNADLVNAPGQTEMLSRKLYQSLKTDGSMDGWMLVERGGYAEDMISCKKLFWRWRIDRPALVKMKRGFGVQQQLQDRRRRSGTARIRRLMRVCAGYAEDARSGKHVFEGSKAGMYWNLHPRQPRYKRMQGKIARIRRYLGAAVAVQDWIGLDTSTAPAVTRRRWGPFHSTAQDAHANVVRWVILRSGLGHWCTAWRRGIRNTRQDKTRQDVSMDVDTETKPNPGGELVLDACCASAEIKVKVVIQPVDGHARNERRFKACLKAGTTNRQEGRFALNTLWCRWDHYTASRYRQSRSGLDACMAASTEIRVFVGSLCKLRTRTSANEDVKAAEN
ncbi:hypothetical protein B0H14DRAFT_3567982 [Mycena olivaceomarginata]|nr:hypothetical protein B0H14DRAFT_3567982 [Mycena olivaceomarginata]